MARGPPVPAARPQPVPGRRLPAPAAPAGPAPLAALAARRLDPPATSRTVGGRRAQAGDRGKEVSALTDLAIIILTEGDPRAAIGLFEQALALARPLGDPARECDIMGNLGMALLHAQQPGRARPMFERGLAHARSTGDPLAEKVALERLGLAASSVGDPRRP